MAYTLEQLGVVIPPAVKLRPNANRSYLKSISRNYKGEYIYEVESEYCEVRPFFEPSIYYYVTEYLSESEAQPNFSTSNCHKFTEFKEFFILKDLLGRFDI